MELEEPAAGRRTTGGLLHGQAATILKHAPPASRPRCDRFPPSHSITGTVG